MSKLDMNIPHPIPCVKKGHTNKQCWLSVMSHGYQPNMQDDILVCNECVSFKDTLDRGFGRRTADQALGTTIAKLLGQLADRNTKLDEAKKELEQKVKQLALIKTVTDAVVRTTDLSKALKIILAGVTSGRAFGFNRAGIFLVDERNDSLEGRDAVGPENWEAARRIWNELESVSFDEQIENILKTRNLEHDYLHRLIEAIRIPLSDSSNFLVQALWADKPTFFRKSEIAPSMAAGILKHLDFNEFVAVPLQAEGLPRGLMVADNYYTHKPITEASIDALQTMANTCTNVLEITLLHEQLSLKLEELQRVNQLLRENQNYVIQAERLADIGKMAAVAAHGFKTPLVTIGGYARRALRHYDTARFKKKDLEIIASEVERLEEITSEILEYSRASKLDIKMHGINELVEESLDFLEHKLAIVGIKLKSKYDSSSPVIAVDEKRFRQVIFNLIDNAVDAMQSGMVLSVCTGAKDGMASLDIIDTGCGIPDDIKDRVFSLFFTTKTRGSGLGLAVSKKIIEDHGGRIEFESGVAQGTRFTVYLPLSAKKPL